MTQAPELKQDHEEFYLEVCTNFAGLLQSFNFKEEISFLHINMFEFRKRANMMLEFQALYVGLWNMALCRSFPHDHEEIFQKYMHIELPQKYSKRLLQTQIQKIEQYKELIQSIQNSDFSPIAHHILSLLDIKDLDYKAFSLKIALHVRSVYTYIFERLF